MSAEIVPFGKYKGQRVEVLAADTDYCEWLTAQPWFKARYLNVYNTVINYGTEPQDSPEHNQMQALFLDDAWCLTLADRLAPERPTEAEEILNRRFESGGWDVVFSVYGPAVEYDDWARKPPPRYRQRKPCPRGAECDGIECECIQQEHLAARIECKPDLGDDYPAVLRQVQRYISSEHFIGTACVLVRRYAFEAVTWEQVKKVFAASSVTLVAESELAPHDAIRPTR